MAATDFQALERTNRRETALLVVSFLLLFTALGFGLDLLIGTVQFTDDGLVGFPLLTVAALIIGIIQS
ncbi:MAG TPA: hypothetical protein VMD75_04075, partial [Candidatus Binataceae bacterium]|nr:hypothetical protein [Candidatus Binataceae bacterium]